MNDNLAAAQRLHGHLVERHWTGRALAGPDPGIRWNSRVGRFVKSYLGFIDWSDDLVYQQAQSYWIFANWLLFDLMHEARYETIAAQASAGVLERQQPGGYWEYPNPEWRGRVATVEGCHAALALLESHSRDGARRFLEGALAWHEYLTGTVGFRRQDDPGMLSVNYFAHSEGSGGGVPNNSTLALWFLARLADATGDDAYLETADALVRWLAAAQTADGELPYSVERDATPRRRHFICFQYNAFEFADLAAYHRLTGDEAVLPILEGLAAYLGGAVNDEGFARYACDKSGIEVPYYTAAVANALAEATELGIADHRAEANRAFARVRSLQRPDGTFAFHSRGNYGMLRDRRSYPRYLAMILKHLLLDVGRDRKPRLAPGGGS